jgi:hypothetical protein
LTSYGARAKPYTHILESLAANETKNPAQAATFRWMAEKIQRSK